MGRSGTIFEGCLVWMMTLFSRTAGINHEKRPVSMTTDQTRVRQLVPSSSHLPVFFMYVSILAG